MRKLVALLSLWLFLGAIFAPATANAYTCATGTQIGSGLCQYGITTTNASNQTTTIPSDWTNTNEIDVISGGSSGSGFGGSTQLAAGCGGTATKLVNTTALTASSTATFFIGVAATTASAGVGTAGSNVFLCPSATGCTFGGAGPIVSAPGAGAVNGNTSAACTPGATASAVPSANAKLGGVGGHGSTAPGGHGGGGAASPIGAGCNGGSTTGSNTGGSGGGGEGGASCTAGTAASSANGASGGANALGTAGPTGGASGNPGVVGTNGTNGTGGSGSGANTGATGGNKGGNGSMGLEWSSISLGAGSGGAGSGGSTGAAVPGAPGDGGQCGGGGGVSGDNNAFTGNAHIGAGGTACIIVTYKSSTFTATNTSYFLGAF